MADAGPLGVDATGGLGCPHNLSASLSGASHRFNPCSAIASFSTSSSANTKPVTAQTPKGTSSHPMLCSLSQTSRAAARLDSLRAYSREHPKTAIVALPTRRRRRPAG